MDFDTWSCNEAFTRNYYPEQVQCTYCRTPKNDAHMCVYNSGEIVKMQPCPECTEVEYYIKYKNYVCKSCFIHCEPNTNFIKYVKESLAIIDTLMSTFLAPEFVNEFICNVRSFLIQNVLTCVPCSFSVKDYNWRTYHKLTSSYRKRRLQSTIVI